MKRHPVIMGLPRAMRELVVELAELDLPVESRATCRSCVVAAPPGRQSADRPFLESVRCCTYHPRLPNFLVGMGLAAGGASRRVLRARMERTLEGVHLLEIGRPLTGHEIDREARFFGRDESLLCPYWIGGDLACGIWDHRGAICRTWYCRHVDGPRGYDVWLQLGHLLARAEYTLARWCADGIDQAPTTVDGWEAWYLACAQRVEAASVVDLAELTTADLHDQARRVDHALDPCCGQIPDLVTVQVATVDRVGDQIRLVGYSSLDARWVTADVFRFLSRLDGLTPWQEALSRANLEVGEPMSEEFVDDLWRAGILVEADPDDLEAGQGVTLTALHLDDRDLLAESRSPELPTLVRLG